MEGNYKYNKKWRKNHAEKRYAGKKRYYDKHRDNAHNSKEPYTMADEELILSCSMPDVEIASKLGRSVQAIQGKRSKLRKG